MDASAQTLTKNSIEYNAFKMRFCRRKESLDDYKSGNKIQQEIEISETGTRRQE